MARRFFALASAASLLLSAATAALSLRASLTAAPTAWHLISQTWGLTLYANRDGLGWRLVSGRGVSGSDFSYGTTYLLTLTFPAAWLWVRIRSRKRVTRTEPRTEEAAEEKILREKIQFLLPPLVAMYIMIGMAAVAIDSRKVQVIAFAALIEVALVWNMIARRRLEARLDRLLAARRAPICRRCGYNLTGNVSGVCPECGVKI